MWRLRTATRATTRYGNASRSPSATRTNGQTRCQPNTNKKNKQNTSSNRTIITCNEIALQYVVSSALATQCTQYTEAVSVSHIHSLQSTPIYCTAADSYSLKMSVRSSLYSTTTTATNEKRAEIFSNTESTRRRRQTYTHTYSSPNNNNNNNFTLRVFSTPLFTHTIFCCCSYYMLSASFFHHTYRRCCCCRSFFSFCFLVRCAARDCPIE